MWISLRLNKFIFFIKLNAIPFVVFWGECKCKFHCVHFHFVTALAVIFKFLTQRFCNKQILWMKILTLLYSKNIRQSEKLREKCHKYSVVPVPGNLESTTVNGRCNETLRGKFIVKTYLTWNLFHQQIYCSPSQD